MKSTNCIQASLFVIDTYLLNKLARKNSSENNFIL